MWISSVDNGTMKREWKRRENHLIVFRIKYIFRDYSDDDNKGNFIFRTIIIVDV